MLNLSTLVLLAASSTMSLAIYVPLDVTNVLERRAEGRGCTVTLPDQPLTAAGLATPWIVSPNCPQTKNADGIPTYVHQIPLNHMNII